MGVLINPYASRAGALLATLAITVGSEEADGGEFFYFGWAGFRTSGSQDDSYGGSTTFGSRSPTSVSGITAEGAYFQNDNGVSSFWFVLDGDQRLTSPFARLDVYNSAGLLVESYAAADATPSYDTSKSCTYWLWGTTDFYWASGDSVNLLVYA